MAPRVTGNSGQNLALRAIGSFASHIVTASKGVSNLIVPQLCAACGIEIGPDSDELCGSCWMELSALVAVPHCNGCGDDARPYLLIDGQCTRCRFKRRPFDVFIRVGRYTGALRSLVLRFKRHFILDRLLGRLLRDALAGKLELSDIDHWVPIPSHWRRRLWRGFQPTSLLTRAAIPKGAGTAESLLTMTRYVPPFHHKMSSRDRSKAIAGAFRMARGTVVRGGTVLIIDDVSTTGATLREAARVVRAAGASRVVVAVIARSVWGA
ncbi:MAG: phosphoribosyltransferase family protein [Planctomycetota bacterium]|nr:phosphoribosyltransferase family protein [Planctomycetota bacterium]